MTRETWDAVSIGNLEQRVTVLERQLSELQADPDGYTARLRRDRAAQDRLDRIARERRRDVVDVSAYDKPATIAGRSAVTRDDDVEPCACRAHSGDNGTAGW